MSLQRLYPYTDAHEVNLDWLLNTVSQINIDEVKSVTSDVAELKTDVEALENATADLSAIRSNASHALNTATSADEKATTAYTKAQNALTLAENALQKNGPATEVSYDPTASQLSAHNVQEAIDALVQSGGGGGGQASEVLYNNATSGISASNVQMAIDVVAGRTYTATLEIGETEINITDSFIDSNSTVDFYTSIYGINPIQAAISGNTLSLVFDEQDEPVDVKVIVR